MKNIILNYILVHMKPTQQILGLAMFLFLAQIAQAQDITVKGTITDVENSQPLPGASVVAKGTSTGVVSDFDGEYSIVVPSNAVLEISYIGYTTQTIPVNGTTIIDVALTAQTSALDEVVVTALGIKKDEKSLGYSVQEVQGSVLEKAPEGNILSNLTGQVAGLTVYNSSEFYDTPSISLRGEKPLVVIDGVPVSTDFWNVSPNDVQEISVLKGATASALYGSKGSGGAIMITTRKGAGGKISVNFNSSTMYKAGYVAIPEPQTVYGTGDNGQYSYGDGAGGGVNDAGTYVWGPRMDVRDPSTASGWKEIAQWDSPINSTTGQRIPTPWVSRGKDNLKNFLGMEYITTNNLNVSQSGEKGTFRVSATHVYQKGQVPNTQLNNATFNLGGTLELSKKFNVDAGLTYNKQYSPNIPRAGYTGNGYVYNLLVWSGTDFDVRDFKDYWLVKDVQQKYYQYTSFYNNPYFLAYENLHGYKQDGTYGYMTLNFDILENLRLTSRTGINSLSVQRSENFPISQGQGNGGYTESNSYDFTVNSDLMLNYDKELIKDLDLSALVGATFNYREYQSLAAGTDGLNVPGFFALSNSANPVSAANTQWQKQLNSAFGKLSLAYRNGLFLDLTGRNDWSSALPSETRSYFYPSASFSGVLSEFVTMPEAISFIKLRASWTLSKKDLDPFLDADTSNPSKGDFDRYYLTPSYSVSSDVWNGQSTASYPGSIRGADVKPEENRTYEFGADLRFFQSRLKLDLSYYNTLNYNFIANAPISDASGFNTKTTNTQEKYEKKGYEIVVNGQIIKNENFSWDSQLNGAVYHWYWKQLDPEFSPQKNWVYPGARTDYLIANDWERDPNGNIIHSNGFPVRSDFESALGQTEPNFVWGWNNNIVYDKFSLSFSFDGRIGGDMFSNTNQAMWNSGSHPESVNQYREAAANGINTYVGHGVVVTSGDVVRDEKGNITSDTRVFAPNDEAVSYITYMKRYNPYIGTISSQNIFDETFVKLREVTLNFNFPQNICEQVGASSASIGLVGRNLWLWTKEVKYVDPDRGADDLSSASYRNVGFNLKLSF